MKIEVKVGDFFLTNDEMCIAQVIREDKDDFLVHIYSLAKIGLDDIQRISCIVRKEDVTSPKLSASKGYTPMSKEQVGKIALTNINQEIARLTDQAIKVMFHFW